MKSKESKESKEAFLQHASELWEKSQQLEETCQDFYSFEAGLEQGLNHLGYQLLQETIGSKKRDRREKKSPDPIRNHHTEQVTQVPSKYPEQPI
jgi:4-alpha-glucanotransferase